MRSTFPSQTVSLLSTPHVHPLQEGPHLLLSLESELAALPGYLLSSAWIIPLQLCLSPAWALLNLP